MVERNAIWKRKRKRDVYVGFIKLVSSLTLLCFFDCSLNLGSLCSLSLIQSVSCPQSSLSPFCRNSVSIDNMPYIFGDDVCQALHFTDVLYRAVVVVLCLLKFSGCSASSVLMSSVILLMTSALRFVDVRVPVSDGEVHVFLYAGSQPSVRDSRSTHEPGSCFVILSYLLN